MRKQESVKARSRHSKWDYWQKVIGRGHGLAPKRRFQHRYCERSLLLSGKSPERGPTYLVWDTTSSQSTERKWATLFMIQESPTTTVMIMNSVPECCM